ncbi:MAG: hypothetical protein M3506_07460 [Chloroflexota bacterium]|nr:hypothetical protein [Chloroflexota bacterium]
MSTVTPGTLRLSWHDELAGRLSGDHVPAESYEVDSLVRAGTALSALVGCGDWAARG